MANNDAAFGMRPTRMIGGAPYTGGQSRYRIAANYDTNIFQGDMVAQVTGGGVEVHADGGTVPIVGVFNGCSYTDPTTSEQVFSNYYPASTNASDIIAFVFAEATSEFSGSVEISIAFIGKAAVVAPVATSSSAPEIPVTVLPEETVAERNAHFERQTENQMKAVDNDLMREENPAMPISRDRKTQVSFGSPKA